MKKLIFLTLTLFFAALALPFARPAAAMPVSETTAAVAETTAASAATAAATTAESTEPPKAENTLITVLRGGEVVTMELEEAVTEVVASEMPALFPEEALRAQAIAARTYLCYRMAHAAPNAHPEAAVCDDASHCCAFAELDALAASWGEHGQEYLDRVRDAVGSTAGEIVTCGGEPIMAVFHAISGPRTESAKDVWGGEISYLQSVAAPEGEKELAGYEGSAVADAAEFAAAFTAKHPSAVLPEGGLGWFTSFVRTEGGTVLSVTVGGVPVSGAEIRSLCGLRSANFTVTQGLGRIRFDTLGYGHGVGLSQYGAKALAAEGKSGEEICLYYYTGCEITVDSGGGLW